ncbi:MAG: RNA-binding protein [Candidatus Marinimicrobia bacterium]|nr:RNA-binding protein [Candidatus Neomarinimicrobiota bacterium]
MNIYVGNLSYDVTEEELKQLFTEFGEVTKATLIMDRETRRSKGFGFIEMKEEAEAEKAMEELDGASIKDRPIKVNKARPRKERPKRKSW